MAKKAMVTRTIISTRATALCLNTVSCEPQNVTATLAGNMNEEKALKGLKEIFENEELKVVKVVSIETQEKLYGMYEEDFISKAFELDEKRNPIK